jgi:5-methyltetrahydrofolate--homocysteine methyltransferase
MMKIDKFVSVGENIHCTRIYKVGGKFCKEQDGGQFAIEYATQDGIKLLPVPEKFMQTADWENGRVKHCAVAIYQGFYGSGSEQEAGIDYLQNLARRQEQAGATYLDINVDEFSTDIAERVKLMEWTVGVVQQAVTIPMSIDSSNLEILKAGLAVCDKGRGRPMVNSVSLERESAVEIARDANAVVIASAAGADSLPDDLDGRMANIDAIYQILKANDYQLSDIHFDPLVFPISTDGQNGVRFLETVKAIREKYGPEVHIVAGLSNVSFGMPNRKLINQVYTWLAVEAGADGGIVDPMQINIEILNELDTGSEPFKLAQDLLLGKDDFGMEYITASRDGRLKG